MDRDNMFVYIMIFVFVFAVWTLSSFVKTSITGYAASDSDTTTASVTINEFISITLSDGFPIAFGSLDPGTTNSSATTNPSNITKDKASLTLLPISSFDKSSLSSRP